MFFEVRKKASHHPKQKIKADHLSSCHNRCNETSWSSLFIVFMLCSIGGIKTFPIIMWKLLSVYLIFRFFVGISALSARFQSAFCPFDVTRIVPIRSLCTHYCVHSIFFHHLQSEQPGACIFKSTKKEQKMPATFCPFNQFTSLSTFSFGLRISSPSFWVQKYHAAQTGQPRSTSDLPLNAAAFRP